jgi:hypothetical protein
VFPPLISKPKNIFPLFLIIAIASVLFALNHRIYAIDDAWITYKYAENLADGNGFVYNPGERVLGTSTPLYTLLLSLFHLLGVSIPFASNGIGFLAMIAGLLGVFNLGRAMESPATGLLAALILAFMPEFHAVSTYGMETPLYIACITFTFYSYVRDRLIWTTILAAACFLIRFDGLAVGFSIFVIHVIAEKKLPWKHALLFIAITAPWLLFSHSYFGTIFPHSFLAKRQHTASHIRTWMIEWLLTRFVLVMAVLGSIVSLPGKRKADSALLLWAICYIIAFSFSNLYGHTWYRSPLCIPLALFAAIGVHYAVSALPFQAAGRRVAQLVLTAILLMPDLYNAGTRLAEDRYGNLPVEEARYQAVQWITQQVEPEAVIATSGIGMIGYFTNNYILDTAGLISPQVVNQGGANEFFRDAIARFHPDYVFQAINRVPDFMKKDYRIIQTWKTGDRIFPQFLLLKRIAPAE